MEHKSRSDELGQLDAFVSEKMKLLSNVLSTLRWDESSLENDTKVQCPKDSNHRVPKSSLPKHLETCAWVKEGYIKDEKEKIPSSSKFFYERASSVDTFNLDKQTVLDVLAEKGLLDKSAEEPPDQYPDLPQTYERWTAFFTSKQRLALYDYVNQRISESQPKTLPIEDLMFDFEKKDAQDEKPKSHLEILAEQRDYKRRRQSYRAKNVHITKKSYTEVIKEVIENQISFLAETRKIETEEKDPAFPRIESESQREESNRRSRSHTPKKKHDEHKKDWSRSRSKTREELDHRSRSHSPKRKRKKHKNNRIRSRSRSKSIEESNHRSHSHTPKKKHKKHKKYWSRRRSGSRSKSGEESSPKNRSRTPEKKRKKHEKDRSKSRSRSNSKSGEETYHRRRSCTPKKKRKKHRKDRSRSKSKSGNELNHKSRSCTPKKEQKKHKKDRSRSRDELNHRSPSLTPKKEETQNRQEQIEIQFSDKSEKETHKFSFPHT